MESNLLEATGKILHEKYNNSTGGSTLWFTDFRIKKIFFFYFLRSVFGERRISTVDSHK